MENALLRSKRDKDLLEQCLKEKLGRATFSMGDAQMEALEA